MKGRNLVNWVLLLCVPAGCGKYHDQNQPEEERAYTLYLVRKGNQSRSSDRNRRQESKAEIMEGRCLLACLVLNFLYTTQDHLPIGGVTHSGPRLSTPIINQESTSLMCSQASGMMAFLELRFLPPLQMVACGGVDKH